jgi:hypothetical protein
MNPGRNNKKKRLGLTATLALLAGAALFAAVPATALSIIGSGAGEGDALWGAYGGLAGGADEDDQDEQYSEGDADMSGAASWAAEGAAAVDATPPSPPDPQPVVDAVAEAAGALQGAAEGEANAALANKDNLAGRGGMDWALQGSADGGYDVVLGGAYAGGLDGTLLAHGDKKASQHADVAGQTEAVDGAKAEAEGAIDGALAQLEELWGKLHASMYVGLDGAADALGSVGMDIAGIFGFNHAADIVNTDDLHLGQQLDVAAPAMQFERPALPDVAIPDLAVDQSGSVAADAAATAEGIVASP